ncbi:MAG: ABC transporter ATP-binding protein, partial [Bacteroidia bacterium]
MQTRAELTIELKDAGKKFGSEWVFRHLNFRISAGDKVVILGGNGSGKSTLLQIISGYVLLNQGQVSFTEGTQLIDPAEH